MNTNSQSDAFWAHPDPEEIAPGDIFPEIPFSTSPYPTRVIRKYRQNLPPKHAQNLHQLFEHPAETETIAPALRLTSPGGDDCATTTRVRMGMFLTYGSEVDSDLLDVQQKGKVGGRVWLAAPVFDLSELPDHSTGGSRTMRETVRANDSGHTFYLERFPSDPPDHLGYYLEFRRICAVGMQFFLDGKLNRLGTLMPQSKNAMYHQMMWFWTRFELFFHPIKCKTCGTQVQLDVRIEGQNVDVDPWEVD
jgi:hypothetical protein